MNRKFQSPSSGRGYSYNKKLIVVLFVLSFNPLLRGVGILTISYIAHIECVELMFQSPSSGRGYSYWLVPVLMHLSNQFQSPSSGRGYSYYTVSVT